MKVYRKEWIQDIKGDPLRIWQFFSCPENLKEITPTDMNFQIQSNIGGKAIYEGMMIVYSVSPFPGWPMTWVTEITHIQEGQHFIDEQRVGPYALWHHEHWFEPTSEGIRMRDILHYAIPFSFLGGVLNGLFIEKKIENIFSYRAKVIQELIKIEVFNK